MTQITMITNNVATVEVDGRAYEVTAEEWLECGAPAAFRDIEIRRIAEFKHLLATKGEGEVDTYLSETFHPLP